MTPQGSQQRFGVTNLEEPAVVVYRDFYVQRGKMPAQLIGEMQNGLQADRLSACGCRANAFRLLVHTLADAIVVLFRAAVAAVPEVATASVSRLRPQLWKLGAVVVTGVRHNWLQLSEPWPSRDLWGRGLAAVQTVGDRLVGRSRPGRPSVEDLRRSGKARGQAANRAADGQGLRGDERKARIPAA